MSGWMTMQMNNSHLTKDDEKIVKKLLLVWGKLNLVGSDSSYLVWLIFQHYDDKLKTWKLEYILC